MLMLKKFIENYVDIPLDEWDIISTLFKINTFNKNEIIVSEGKICRYFYFLEEGLVHHFINHNGNNTSKFFIPAPYCFTSRLSFLNQTVTSENIQAIEKCVVFQITWQQYYDLMELKSWNSFTRKILNEVQDITEERLFTNLTETAELTYKKMLIQNPGLLSRIPLKYLASYLGITSQSLSRIRKKY